MHVQLKQHYYFKDRLSVPNNMRVKSPESHGVLNIAERGCE